LPWQFIALSLLLHLPLLLTGRASRPWPAAAEKPPRLDIRLSERVSPAPPSTNNPPHPKPAAQITATRTTKTDRPPAPDTPAAVIAAISAAPAKSTGTDVQAMIAQGKSQLDQEARQRMFDPMFARPAAKAPALHPLARATAAPVVGERQLTERIHQYTLADGRRFCVTTPPTVDLANNDGQASGQTLVATNCPR